MSENTTVQAQNEPVASLRACKIAGCTKSMKNGCHGVCRTHYKMLLNMVRKGEVTWLVLEEKGITDPASSTRDPKDRELLDGMLASALA